MKVKYNPFKIILQLVLNILLIIFWLFPVLIAGFILWLFNSRSFIETLDEYFNWRFKK